MNVNAVKRRGAEVHGFGRHTVRGSAGRRLAAGDLMPRNVAAALAVGLLAAGCAVDSPTLESTLVMRSAYDPLTCPEVVSKYKAADGRMKELAALMEKSGSPVANALAYDTEFATARANKRFAEQAAERKGCDLAGKPPATAPQPPPPPAAQPDAKKQ
jgi:hypothetical protein